MAPGRRRNSRRWKRNVTWSSTQAVGEADLLLFVVDALAGVHPSDAHVAEMMANCAILQNASSGYTHSTGA